MSRLTHPAPAPAASSAPGEVPPGDGTLTQVQEELLLLLNGEETAPPPRAAVVEAPPPPASPVPAPGDAPPEKVARSGAAGAQDPEAKTEGCPSCGFTGSWGMGSWCPECGYFPRVGRQGDAIEAADPEDALPPTLWSLIPGWIWALLGGMAGIMIVSASMPLVLKDPLHRGAAAAVQLGIGLLLGISSQVRAFIYAMKTHEQYKFYAIVTSPLAIWRGPIKLLPQTRPVFFCAAWGWTAALGAGLFMGLHWPVLLKAFQDYMAEVRKAEALNVLPKESKDKAKGGEKKPGEMSFGEFIGEIGKTLAPEEEKPKMKFKVKKEKSEKDIDELMEDLVSEVPVDMKDSGAEEGKTEDALKKAGDAAKNAEEAAKGAGDAAEGKDGESGDEQNPADDEPTGQRCLIIGYTANASGEVRSLLVAVPLKDGKLRFAAKLPLDSLTNRDLAELRKVLAKIRTKNPATPCPYGGVWVRPVLQCHVEHDGWTSDGRLRSPNVEELVIERTEIRERSASRTPTLR